MKKKIKTKEKSIKNLCPECKEEKNWQWLEISSGQQKLFKFCCMRKEDKGKYKTGFNLYYKKYRDPVAFGTKDGKPVAVDKKGQFFDPLETRYAGRGMDIHGWRATGKIPKKKTYFV